MGYVDLNDERVDDVLRVVKGWGWDGAWREEEEWMGDT
jgi:hypothetical protein